MNELAKLAKITNFSESNITRMVLVLDFKRMPRLHIEHTIASSDMESCPEFKVPDGVGLEVVDGPVVVDDCGQVKIL
jgi:hypothetical protein